MKDPVMADLDRHIAQCEKDEAEEGCLEAIAVETAAEVEADPELLAQWIGDAIEEHPKEGEQFGIAMEAALKGDFHPADLLYELRESLHGLIMATARVEAQDELRRRIADSFDTNEEYTK